MCATCVQTHITTKNGQVRRYLWTLEQVALFPMYCRNVTEKLERAAFPQRGIWSAPFSTFHRADVTEGCIPVNHMPILLIQSHPRRNLRANTASDL